MKKHIIYLFTIASAFCACDMEKDFLSDFPVEEVTIDTSLPETTLKFSSEVSDTTIVLNFDENSFSQKAKALKISRAGICYSTTEKSPSLENGYNFDVYNGNDKLNLKLTFSLQKPSTTWYIRTFAVNARGVSYGQTQEVSTYGAFSRLTLVNHLGMGNNSDVKEHYSTSSHTILTRTILVQAPADKVVEQGVCYSLNENPTIDDAHAYLLDEEEYPVGTGVAIMNNLQPNTVYHIRAYAKHSGGHIIYSKELAIKTRNGIPSLSIKKSAGSFTGTIKDYGGSIYYQRGGFCYATGHMPTLEDAYITPVALDRDQLKWSMYSIEDKLAKGTKYLVRFFTFEDPIEYNEDGTEKPLPEITAEYLATKKIYYSDPESFEL